MEHNKTEVTVQSFFALFAISIGVLGPWFDAVESRRRPESKENSDVC